MCCEIGITYKTNKTDGERLEKVESAIKAFKLFKPFFADCMELEEKMYAMYINSGNEVLGIMNVGVGNVKFVHLNMSKIMQGALMCNCVAIILCHNHPSGKLVPSISDKTFTNKVKDACELFDIRLEDHIIVSYDDYYSFMERGLL